MVLATESAQAVVAVEGVGTLERASFVRTPATGGARNHRLGSFTDASGTTVVESSSEDFTVRAQADIGQFFRDVLMASDIHIRVSQPGGGVGSWRIERYFRAGRGG